MIKIIKLSSGDELITQLKTTSKKGNEVVSHTATHPFIINHLDEGQIGFAPYCAYAVEGKITIRPEHVVWTAIPETGLETQYKDLIINIPKD